ncbi:thioredoxin-related transmembrane protein 4 [Pelodytes ibericus]
MVGFRRTTMRVAEAAYPSRVAPRPVIIKARVKPLLLVAALACCVPGSCWAKAAQAGSAVRPVTSSNWSVVLEGEWMVKFYAPWCPACQQIQTEWDYLGQKSHALDIKVGKVDVTQEPGLSGRFFVTTLPTIFHAKDGVFRRYHGSRMGEDLQTFILEKKWALVEPVAGWKSPSSILMSGMAGLFHLSGWIRQIHNYFTGPLGIPAWGSYIIFILATLLIGLLLGLILVLLSDCFCPSKAKYEVLRAEVNEENLGVPGEDPKDSSEENKEPSDNEGDSEGDNEGDNDGDSDRESEDDNEVDSERSSGAKESEEDSAEEDSGTEDVDNVSAVQQPSVPESESALRQRRSEAVVDNEK